MIRLSTLFRSNPPICIHNGKAYTLGEPGCYYPSLAVIMPGVFAFHRGTIENQRREFEVESRRMRVELTLSADPK